MRRSPARWLVAALAVVLTACADATAPVGSDARSGTVPSPGTTPGAPADPTMPIATNPVAGLSLYVSPSSRARATADAWRLTRPADAAVMDQVAAQPQARWFGNWNADIRADVDAHVTAAGESGALPVLVAYNIPLRDCGSYSAGGASGLDAYRRWISDYAAGIGARRALVILEPDAVAGLGCLSATEQRDRYELLSYAIDALRANPATLVYLDAGNHRWQSANVIASRLTSAGVARATGFALNVSNFFHTSDEAAYGNAISALVGGKHYVIDTSRNGVGPTADAQWCNPADRALGQRPTASTGIARADAFLWIKVPGESDGSCSGYPASGTWMPEVALDQARRAGY